MREYSPDAWVIIKVCSEEGMYYKVLAGWYGGYLSGDSWKINSGITKVNKVGSAYEFFGHSGSIYFCHESTERLTGLTSSILSSYQRAAKGTGTIEVVSVEDVLNYLKENHESL